MFGLPIAIACSFLLPVGAAYLTALFPHNHMMSGFFGIPILVGAVLWMVPMYYIFTKVYNIRLEYGRKYVDEKKWKEADAALGSTDPLMLKIFDRTGEAHYLWAKALDGLGKKNTAETARNFLRKRRPRSEYTAMLGDMPVSQTLSISEIRNREKSKSDSTSNLIKTKRRRF
jgi:hypothetical protein